ncbi:peptidase T [Pedobacter sp. HMF7647]|uniref:Peptidase T n=1 Tax=Hufsiella arboris TaxID=2695275 RepID=A0A7K1Y652_9SPHI|nr:peptidase T [Hufsiella arboris]MXV49891.1 peptidase T [Hufsiella arboris]
MPDFSNYKFTVSDRFLNYVQIDTQSDPQFETYPSTSKQKNLGNVLVNELKKIGISDAELDEFGYVYATIPANSSKTVPVVCFCSHMDTSPDCSGENVKPIIHKNYQGGDIVLPDDPSQILKMADHADLRNQLGNDIITASGTTLLGADNKAGLAEIMEAANFLISHPEIKHGTIKILFTPDEEIGRGVDKVDLKRLAADFAYTIDGETLGSVENETFSADGAKIKISGVSTHPGFAKGKMQSAIKIASEIVAALPADLSPENTNQKQGFMHPVSISGHVEEATVELILRDFDNDNLAELGLRLNAICRDVLTDYPDSSFKLEIKEQYRNMKSVLDQYPKVTEFAVKAIEKSGLDVKLQSIRGGTDGSRLSFMGLPCPNIFAGEHAFHSRLEWVSVQDMQKAVETIINLACIWHDES